MKLGVPIDGWVLAKCEGCGQRFPTRAWHPSDRKRPDHYFCTEKCRVSGRGPQGPKPNEDKTKQDGR